MSYDASKRKRRQRYNRWMKWMRRIHLYSGLFLLPWVLLYGVTALLFNHPTVFSPWEGSRFDAPKNDDDPFAGMPSPEAVAEEVATALAARIGEETGGAAPEYRVIDSHRVRFDQEFIVEAFEGESVYRVRVDPRRWNGVSAKLEGSETAAPEPATFERQLVETAAPYIEKIVAEAGRLLEQRGVEHESAALRFAPLLHFEMEAHDSRFDVTYAPETGIVSGIEILEQQGDALGTRDYLTELHLAHGYPTNPKMRFFWAIVVDLMFAAMVFWAFSGVLMWIQIKSVRWKGLAFLGASALITVYLVYGMYAELNL